MDEPNTVVGEAALLARASNSCFNSSRSGALSCTKSTSVTASSGVETKVMVGTMTSSPGFKFNSNAAISNECVHDVVNKVFRVPTLLEISSSESLVNFPLPAV